MVQWLFFFYFYCFAGWCFESTYVSIKSRQVVNRGFMRGPFLPLYGSGGMMMLIVSYPFREHQILVYLAGCIGATALEYVTGVAMEALFKVRYWDYSNQKFNFQGHICLKSSLFWGVLTLIFTNILHKPIEHMILSIPGTVLAPVTLILTVIITADFSVSFKSAMDMRDILVALEKVRTEMEHMKKRMDVLIAVADSDLNALKEQGFENMENLKAELAELRIRYNVSARMKEEMGQVKSFFQRKLMKAYPHMTSQKFKDALEEFKTYLDGKIHGEE